MCTCVCGGILLNKYPKDKEELRKVENWTILSHGIVKETKMVLNEWALGKHIAKFSKYYPKHKKSGEYYCLVSTVI